MDIRSFFAPKTNGSNTKSKKTDDVVTSSKSKSVNRPKPILSDSSSEDEDKVGKGGRKSSEKKQKVNDKSSKSKKRVQTLSDSDDDAFIPSSIGKKKTESNGHSKAAGKAGKAAPTKCEEKPKEKLKPVTPDDFFAKAAPTTKLPKIPKLEKKESPVKLTSKVESSKDKKRKSPDDQDFFADDDEFESMMQGIDFDEEMVKPSPVKKSKLSDEATKPIGESLAQKLSSKVKKEEETIKKKDSEEMKREEKSIKVEMKKHCDIKKEDSRSPKKKTDEKKEKSKTAKPSPVKIKVEEKVEVKTAIDVAKASPKKVESSQSSQSQPSSVALEASELWVEKYKPTTTKAIIGQQGDSSNMRKLTTWIQNWAKNNSGPNKKGVSKPPPWNSGADNGFWAKAALLSGPPGVGKTTTAYLVAKEFGYDVMELNASDTRSKKQLGAVVSDAVNSQSLSNVSTKRILLMDEVDGMAGNEDRGGVAELIQLIKTSKIPVICMCNDRNHPKIRSLANHCFDLRFQRPRIEQIRAAMMSICFKEKVKIAPDALNELISGCNQDIRQVLHHLSMVKAKDLSDSVDGKYSKEDAIEEADRSKKTSIKVGPWDVCRKVFSAQEQKGMNLSDKSDLFFHDYSIGPLFVQENYLSVMPYAANNDPKKAIILASKAADSLCEGDLVERLIRSNNSWSLLPVQAMYSSVLPGEYMSGHVQGMIQFPNWLGKNSKQGKTDRILQELQMHTRLSAGMSKRSLNMDFLQHLRDALLRPMINDGADGVQESVKVMSQYSLLREDLDNLLEVTQWPDRADPMKNVESKVKAAFTRTYNKEVILPYATNLGSIAKRSVAITSGEMLLDGEEDDGEDEDEKEDDDNIESDAMIKAKKPKATKAAASTSQSPTPKASRGGKATGARGGRGGRGKK